MPNFKYEILQKIKRNLIKELDRRNTNTERVINYCQAIHIMINNDPEKTNQSDE